MGMVFQKSGRFFKQFFGTFIVALMWAESREGARGRGDRKPGVALRYTPGCVLAPFQGAHSHHKISHICRRQMSTPHRHLWKGGGRQAGAEVTFPSQNRQRPQRGRLFPLANYLTSAVGRCLHPIAIYGEGLADRPGLRSGGQGVRSKINGQGLRSKTRGMN